MNVDQYCQHCGQRCLQHWFLGQSVCCLAPITNAPGELQRARFDPAWHGVLVRDPKAWGAQAKYWVYCQGRIHTVTVPTPAMAAWDRDVMLIRLYLAGFCRRPATLNFLSEKQLPPAEVLRFTALASEEKYRALVHGVVPMRLYEVFYDPAGYFVGRLRLLSGARRAWFAGFKSTSPWITALRRDNARYWSRRVALGVVGRACMPGFVMHPWAVFRSTLVWWLEHKDALFKGEGESSALWPPDRRRLFFESVEEALRVLPRLVDAEAVPERRSLLQEVLRQTQQEEACLVPFTPYRRLEAYWASLRAWEVRPRFYAWPGVPVAKAEPVSWESELLSGPDFLRLWGDRGLPVAPLAV